MSEIKVSLEKLQTYINSKYDLYEATIRNGFYLSNYKSSLITEEYLTNVIQGKIWCPMFKDIRLLSCYKPPSKDILLEKLQLYLQKEQKNAGIDIQHTPDKKWVLNLLSTYLPKDEIFDKNYVPPSKKIRLQQYRSIELPPNFIKGLPPKSKKVKARRLKLFYEGALEAKITRMKDAKNHLEKSLEQYKHKLIEKKESRKKRKETQKNQILEQASITQISKTPQKNIQTR